MSVENERENSRGLSPKKAAYLALEIAWAYFLPWAEPPTKLRMSTWYNVAVGDWERIVDLIEAASLQENVTDPQWFVWNRLRNITPARPRHSDSDRVRTWQAPQGSA